MNQVRTIFCDAKIEYLYANQFCGLDYDETSLYELFTDSSLKFDNASSTKPVMVFWVLKSTKTLFESAFESVYPCIYQVSNQGQTPIFNYIRDGSIDGSLGRPYFERKTTMPDKSYGPFNINFAPENGDRGVSKEIYIDFYNK
jgi:hypothetical protein